MTAFSSTNRYKVINIMIIVYLRTTTANWSSTDICYVLRQKFNSSLFQNTAEWILTDGKTAEKYDFHGLTKQNKKIHTYLSRCITAKYSLSRKKKKLISILFPRL